MTDIKLEIEPKSYNAVLRQMLELRRLAADINQFMKGARNALIEIAIVLTVFVAGSLFGLMLLLWLLLKLETY